MTGVTLYCMLTGKLPFNVENPIDLFEAVKTQEYVHIKIVADDRPLIPTDWPHDQADLVKRMLIKNPTDRIRMRDIRVCPSMSTELIVGTPMGNGTWCRGNDYKRRQFVLCRTTGRGAYTRGVGFGYSAQEGYLVSLSHGQS